MRRCSTLSRPCSQARTLVVLAGCAALLAAVGCVGRGTYDRVVAERDELRDVRRDLESRLERAGASTESLGAERLKLLEEIEDLRVTSGDLEVDMRRLTRAEAELTRNLESSQLRLADREALLANREAEISNMRNTYDGLVADLEEEVASGQIQIEQLRSGLRLNLSQEILFSSGSAAINPSGAAVLRTVAGRLRELPHTVEVVGHTDNIPIGTRYPSNWELAAARASSVVRLLAAAGLDPLRLAAVSRGEYEPLASNDTREGRAKNRRIEIRLEPPPRGTVGEEAAAPVAPGPESSGQ